MSTGQREKCVFSHPGITFVTWNTCGSAEVLYQPFAGGRLALAILLHGDEAKTFVGVEYSKYAVVAELRQYVAVSLHLLHSGYSDAEANPKRRI